MAMSLTYQKAAKKVSTWKQRKQVQASPAIVFQNTKALLIFVQPAALRGKGEGNGMPESHDIKVVVLPVAIFGSF